MSQEPKRQSNEEFDLNEQQEPVQPEHGTPQEETPVEESMFSGVELDSDEIMVAPKSHSYDPAKEEVRKQKTRKLLGILGGLVIVAILVVIVIWAVNKANETKQNNMTPPSPSASATMDESTSPAELEMTAMQREYPNAPKVESGQTTMKVEGNIITASNGNSIALPETFTMGKTNNNCDMKMNTDFCLIANGTYGENEQPNIDIYYFKDLVHTKLFEEPEKFELFEKEGSPVSAHTTLKVGDSTIPATTIALEDSSGWVITQSDTKDTVSTDLINGITLKKE